MSFTTRSSFRASRSWAALTVLIVATLAGAKASALQINDFDSGLETWRYDFGGASTPTHDPTVGSPGNAMGSLKLVFNFPTTSSTAFTGDLFFPPQNLSVDSMLLFDILVDPSSGTTAFSTHGYLDFVSRETNGYNWGNQTGRNLPAVSGWQTFSVPTAAGGAGGIGMTQTRALTIQLFGGAGQNIQSPVTLWLDNIRTVPEPASLALAAAVLVAGLGCVRRVRHAG
jgi:hypothetical protein